MRMKLVEIDDDGNTITQTHLAPEEISEHLREAIQQFEAARAKHAKLRGNKQQHFASTVLAPAESKLEVMVLRACAAWRKHLARLSASAEVLSRQGDRLALAKLLSSKLDQADAGTDELQRLIE